MSQCGDANSVPWGAASTLYRGTQVRVGSDPSVPGESGAKVDQGAWSESSLSRCAVLSLLGPVKISRSWSDVSSWSSIATPDELSLFFPLGERSTFPCRTFPSPGGTEGLHDHGAASCYSL